MWYYYHYSTGSNPEWTKVLPAGTYTLTLVNWKMNERPNYEYSLQVYADKNKVTVNGAHGEKFSSTHFDNRTKKERPDSPTHKE